MVGWAILIFASPGLVAALAALAIMAAGSLLTAFCVQHDANHGAYFRARRCNHLLGWTPTCCSASQLRLARQAQRRPPHVHERRRLDDDIDADADRATLADAGAAPVVPLPALLHLAAVRPHGRCAGSSSPTSPRSSAAASGSDDAPAARLGPGGARRRQGCLRRLGDRRPAPRLPVVAGAPGYFGRDVIEPRDGRDLPARALRRGGDFATAEDSPRQRFWAAHEVETTVDFCPRNRFLTWLLGGLNYQIEHHLFPRVRTRTTRTSRRSCGRSARATRSAMPQRPAYAMRSAATSVT